MLLRGAPTPGLAKVRALRRSSPLEGSSLITELLHSERCNHTITTPPARESGWSESFS